MATEAIDDTTRGGDGNTTDMRIPLERRFSDPAVHPWDAVTWEKRDIEIPDFATGGIAFAQDDVEVPVEWSQSAAQIAASKYFRYPMDSPQRERSVRTMIDRVVNTYAHYGRRLGYFADDEQGETFAQELRTILVSQRAAFNSPVWFNTGVEARRRSKSESGMLGVDHPEIEADEPWMGQVSACFILGVNDTMESIQEWIATESEIFRGGSGAGTNLSKLRADGETLSAGGSASGPVSFMRWADSGAGSIKSGGGTRRAAKMVILNGDHPDVGEFVSCKVEEEKKAYALGEMGYDMGFNGEAWRSVQFQNANNSVRLTDEFFLAYEQDADWDLHAVSDGSVTGTTKARDLMREISAAAWACGDPGLQYDSTIQNWHTTPNAGRINGSNPCSEYMHLDDSACNLASINLMQFVDDDGNFLIDDFTHTVDVMILAMDIAVDPAAYPTAKIGATARDYRQLGLGYANLGSLLMSGGLPYDSDEGRSLAASITALMQNRAYARSAEIAGRRGAYTGYADDQDGQDRVVRMHSEAVTSIADYASSAEIRAAAAAEGGRAVAKGQLGESPSGYRNAQMSVLAPTGTIGFLMDCDTTGIEPGIALVSYKTLAGGGNMKLVNGTVPRALRALGYHDDAVATITEHITEHDTIEGSVLADEHLPVFDCAFRAQNGTRSIAPEGHVRMMGAVQPFLSGAISKTVNMPNDATVEEIEEIYLLGHREGLKAVAIYRDGSKRTQPLRTTEDEGHDDTAPVVEAKAVRRRLPATRQSITHKFQLGQQEGYVTFGLFEDGSPGEVFIKIAKEGSTVSGLMESIGILWSMALQHGVPPETIISKFVGMSFEPSGFTQNSEIQMAKSLMDYLARLQASLFIDDAQTLASLGVRRQGIEPADLPGDEAPSEDEMVLKTAPLFEEAATASGRVVLDPDGTACPGCGSTNVAQTGTCKTCMDCGQSIGGCS